MTDATRFQFNNPSVPKAYDEFLVPRISEPWAKVLLEEADLRPGESALDIATGLGTVARLAAGRVGAKGRVVATDIAPPMLDIAKAKRQPSAAAPIDYVLSPAAPLAAPAGTFDAVLCQQGLQFFPDRPSALGEMRRVLRPSGRTAIAVWAELERNQVYAAFHAALKATVRSDLAELITAPFSWPSGTALKSAAEDAGFRNVRLSTHSLPMVRRRITRAKLLDFFASLPACLVGVEACPSAHYWSRRLGALGHTVRLLPPSYVKAYLKRSKNDANDAAAICEAVTRPSMRFVATKSEQQQSGLMLHRSRQLLVCQRTMLSNAIRGHMAELGMISAKGRNGTAELLKIIADENDDRIPPVARLSLDVLARQYTVIRAEIVAIQKRSQA